MWITLKEYADKEGISYTAARKAFLKYGSELIDGGHVKEERRATLIDEYAVEYLSSKRKWGKGSSLVRNVQYKKVAKRAVETMPDVVRVSDSSNKSVEDILGSIEMVQDDIDKVRQELLEDYEQIAIITRRIKRRSKKIENLESKKDRLYQKILDRKKNEDAEALTELIRQLEKEDSQGFRSVRFLKTDGKE